jgi:hypothetical protein
MVIYFSIYLGITIGISEASFMRLQVWLVHDHVDSVNIMGNKNADWTKPLYRDITRLMGWPMW